MELKTFKLNYASGSYLTLKLVRHAISSKLIKFLRGLKISRRYLKQKALHLIIGQIGEDIACKYLLKTQFIYARNWTASIGEIDIATSEKSTIIFHEVKTRRAIHLHLFPAHQAVTRKKQDRIKKLATDFIINNWGQLNNRGINFKRYDTISVYYNLSALGLKLNWYLEHRESGFGPVAEGR